MHTPIRVVSPQCSSNTQKLSAVVRAGGMRSPRVSTLAAFVYAAEIMFGLRTSSFPILNPMLVANVGATCVFSLVVLHRLARHCVARKQFNAAAQLPKTGFSGTCHGS